MEGSNQPSAATAPEATPSIGAEGETPFSRQYVRLTKQEHIERTSQIAFWKAQHARAVEREKALEKELEEARAEIRDLRQRLYGRKSEKAAPRDDRTFTGGRSSRPRGQQKGAKGHGRTARPRLPVVEEIQDVPSGTPGCPICHQPYVEFFRTEDSDVIEVQVRAHIRRIKRKMYRRGCQCEQSPGLITAPLPPRLLPRNPLGISVWVEVLLDKYLYARPTHRLLQHYASLGLPISQGTITDGLKRLARLFDPLIAAMHEKQMSESLFFGDETGWMVFETVEGKSGRRWYLWVTLSASVRFYRVATSRATAVPREHFATLSEAIECAILVCDRYSAYKCLAKEMPALLLAFCWAHVRRDFIEAARRYPPHKDWMFEWVEAIRELYRINKQRLCEWNPERALEEQAAPFNRHHQDLIKALSAMEQRRDAALRQSDLPEPQRAVLTSLKTHWAGLTVFVTHPEVPMDNNTGERGVRKGVLGRNAYHGSGSQWSAHLMAAMLTVLQTLVHWGVNAHHWMSAFLSACAENGGQVPAGSHVFPALDHERGPQAGAQPTPGAAKLPRRARFASPAVLRRYCGRDFAPEELALIRRLIAEDLTATRADLSRRLCERIGWYKADGGLKEMSARVAMLRMQDDGLIRLPPPTGARPQSCIRATAATDPGPALAAPVHALPPLQLVPVHQRTHSQLWNEYIHRYHYLGYATLPGAQLRYFVTAGEQLLALLGFGASAWQCAPRDHYIGWSHTQRTRNLHLVVNNARFLILPWIRSKNLASKILALAARTLPEHWQQRYAYCPVLMETFVDTERFAGTCYRAANWQHIGQTKGRGKLGPSGKRSVPIKDLWLYPLDPDYRRLLTLD